MPPLLSGAVDWTAYGALAAPYKTINSAVSGAAFWQYATTPMESSCSTSQGYTDNTASGVLNIPGDRYQCRLRTVGDWQQYTHYVDLNSMDTTCDTLVPRFEKVSSVAKYVFSTVDLGSYASTLATFLNASNPDITATASTLGEEPEFLVHLQSMFAGGGASVTDNRLVEDVDYVSSPTAGNTVSNSSFEDGTTSGWTTTGSVSAIGFQPAWGGTRVAQVGQTTSVALDSTLAQTFTVPTAGARSLSLYYQIKCFDLSVTYDQFWITLRDETTSSNFTLVPQTCSNDGTFKHLEYPLTGFEGHTLTLTVRTHDDGAGNYPTYGWVDEIFVNTIGNGGFQAASTLSQWTSTGITASYTHPTGSNAKYGSAGAQVGSSSPYTDSSLSQTFTIPSWGVTALSFDRKVVCLDSVTYAWLKVTLVDNTSGKTYTVLAPTCSNNGAWESTSFSVDTLAGHNVTLRFDVHDDNYPGDPIYALIDDIKLR